MTEFECKECNTKFNSQESLDQHSQAKHKQGVKTGRKLKIKKNHLFALGIIIITVAAGFWMYTSASTPGKYDEFAKCLGEKGAKFYGAFWCPHCQNQKAMFGKSAHLLPYVECSTPNGSGQLAVCTDKGVNGYPTWEFADGTKESGEIEIEHLAEKTGCSLPQ